MTNTLKIIGGCCLAVLMALYVVGAVSHGSLRHEVQTLPLWVPIVAGLNRRDFARWCALPCLVFWLGHGVDLAVSPWVVARHLREFFPS